MQGDEILGQLTLLNNGSWITNATNLANSVSTAFTYQPYLTDYNYAYEVLEAYNVEQACNLYPQEGVVSFVEIQVEAGGKPVTPTWSAKTQDNLCNEMAQVVSPQSVEIKFNTQ